MNVLIVDDEPVIRLGMRTMVDWEKHGFRLVGEAADGEEALDIIAQTRVDLVVTDLLMPRMDGLALMRMIKQREDAIGIVVLSCLDDFSWVREAMKLGAFDYILKPTMEPEQLIGVLGQVREQLLKSRQEQERHERWRQEQEQSRQMRLSRRLAECFRLGFADPDVEAELFGGGSYVFSLLVWKPRQLFLDWRQDESCLAGVVLQERELLLLYAMERAGSAQELHGLRFAKAGELAKRLRQAAGAAAAAGAGGGPVLVGVGPAVTGPAGLLQLPAWHGRQLHGHFYASAGLPAGGNRGGPPPGGPGPVALLAEAAPPPPPPQAAAAPLPYEARADLLRALDSANAAGVGHQTERLAASVCAARPPLARLTPFVRELLAAAADQARQRGWAAADDFAERYATQEAVSAHLDSAALFSWLAQALDELLLQSRSARPAAAVTANPFVRKALEYMQSHYAEAVSTQSIADHVRLNRTYLSELYSRETGETLGETLISIRIEAAKGLLSEGKLKVYEVAEATGFNDPKVFAKAFKRMVGCTPKEYV